jgi:hypothetical protein
MTQYVPDSSGRLWWCNSHQRRATAVFSYPDGRTRHCCAPGLGGILLPCSAVDLTDEVEIVDCASADGGVGSW